MVDQATIDRNNALHEKQINNSQNQNPNYYNQDNPDQANYDQRNKSWPGDKPNQPDWSDQQQPTNDPGNKPNATIPRPKHKNPDAVEHAAVGTEKTFEGSGKDMGLVNPPIVSMHATSEQQGTDKVKSDFQVIDNANFKLNHHLPIDGHYSFNYPFEDLDVGQGLFIPVEPNSTTDKLMSKMYKQIDIYRKQNSEIERDENGDDIMEDIAINQKKRNDDGTVQLDGDVPRLGIKSGFRPKLIGPTFTVKAVVKGDDLALTDDDTEDKNSAADRDGVLVIRLN